MTTRVLVTGFEAFKGTPVNPSAEVASHLAGTEIAGASIAAAVLPVDASELEAALDTAIGEAAPDVVLALGVAPGRPAPALERVAINVADFPIPDNSGWRATGEPIDRDGPAAYLTTLPIKAILAAWADRGIPGYVSNSAGTFLCNQVFYLLGRWAAESGKAFGLIHLPSDQAGACRSSTAIPPPSLPVETMTACVRIGIEVTLTHTGPDLTLPAGALS